MANTAPTAPYTYTKHNTPLTDNQVAQAAYNAGFRGSDLVTAVAVGLAEQGGSANATALNDNGEFSVGIWQVNVNGYLVSRLRHFGFSSWQDLWNPDKNAQAAYSISGGGKHWGAWTTYNDGRYLKYVDRANTAAHTITGQDPVVIDANEPGPTPQTDAQKNATAFLTWWNNRVWQGDADSARTWNDFITEFETSTGNTAAGDYVKNVINTDMHIPLDVPLGITLFSSIQPVMEYLGKVVGTDTPEDVGLPTDNGLFGPIISFFTGLTDQLEHGAYIVIVILIGLVLIVVGFKSRQTNGAEA